MKKIAMDEMVKIANTEYEEWDQLSSHEYADMYLGGRDPFTRETLKEFDESGFLNNDDYLFIKALKNGAFDLYAEDDDAILCIDNAHHKVIEYQK